MKMRCRKLRKLILTSPDCDQEQILDLVSAHLPDCGACRRLHADLQKMGQALSGRKARFDEVARRYPIGKAPVIPQGAPLARRPAWRFRAAWMGAAATLLIIAAAVFFPFSKGGRAPSTARPPISPIPTVTRAVATESFSRTLLGIAEILHPREAPALGIPYVPPPLPRESFYPQLAHRSALESDARLGRIVQSRISLLTPSSPRRESFFPRLPERSTTESQGTLGKILRSRVNLTRRQDT